MSPSESDLRAALRHGEHADDLDVDGIVAAGRAARGRRTRLLSAAAAAVVVAGVGVGVSLTAGGGNGPTGPVAERSRTAPSTSSHRPAGTTQAVTGKSPGPAVVQPDINQGTQTVTTPFSNCSPPSLHSPHGGTIAGTPSVDTSGPLFPRAVTKIDVCVNGATLQVSGSAASQVTLTGSSADTVVASLQRTTRHAAQRPCPAVAVHPDYSIAIVGYDAAGTAMPEVASVVRTGACDTTVTNGKVTRHDWTIPAVLANLIHTRPHVLPHIMSGSPAK